MRKNFDKPFIIIYFSVLIVLANILLVIFLFDLEFSFLAIGKSFAALSIALMFVAVIVIQAAELDRGKNPRLYRLAGYLYYPLKGRLMTEEELKQHFESSDNDEYAVNEVDFAKKFTLLAFALMLTFFILGIYFYFALFR